MVAALTGILLFMLRPKRIDTSKWTNTDLKLETQNLNYIRVPTYNPNVTLNVIETGQNKNNEKLVILLHGFPETALVTWHHHLQVLNNKTEYYVLAPDMRGYNTSSKPEGIYSYVSSELIADVHALIKHSKRPKAYIVAHDWGGSVAWNFAMKFPDMVEKLVVIDAPHPTSFGEGLLKLGGWSAVVNQLFASWYIFFFNVPSIPEMVISRNNFNALKNVYDKLGKQGHISKSVLNDLETAWKGPGALTSMLNYYRAIGRPSGGEFAPAPASTTVRVPTLVIWGVEDTALTLEVGRVSYELGVDDSVKEQSKFVPLENVGHFVPHERHALLTEHILVFLKQ